MHRIDHRCTWVSYPWAFKTTVGINHTVTHGQCDARPTVIFPASEHHHPSARTTLYCLVTEVGVRNTRQRSGYDSYPRHLAHQSNTVPRGYRATALYIDSSFILINVQNRSLYAS